MDKYIYAVTMNIDENGKLWAEAIRFRARTNILPYLKESKHIVTFNIMPSKKKAVETAVAWEQRFIENGTAFFDRADYAKYVSLWT